MEEVWRRAVQLLVPRLPQQTRADLNSTITALRAALQEKVDLDPSYWMRDLVHGAEPVCGTDPCAGPEAGHLLMTFCRKAADLRLYRERSPRATAEQKWYAPAAADRLAADLAAWCASLSNCHQDWDRLALRWPGATMHCWSFQDLVAGVLQLKTVLLLVSTQ